jgi:hypothetical protein
MVSQRFSFIAALVTLVIATPTDRSALLVHEHRAQPARGFVTTSPAPSDTELTLRIALNPNNIAGLESELYAVFDPSSSATVMAGLLFVIPAYYGFRISGSKQAALAV